MIRSLHGDQSARERQPQRLTGAEAGEAGIERGLIHQHVRRNAGVEVEHAVGIERAIGFVGGCAVALHPRRRSHRLIQTALQARGPQSSPPAQERVARLRPDNLLAGLQRILGVEHDRYVGLATELDHAGVLIDEAHHRDRAISDLLDRLGIIRCEPVEGEWQLIGVDRHAVKIAIGRCMLLHADHDRPRPAFDVGARTFNERSTKSCGRNGGHQSDGKPTIRRIRFSRRNAKRYTPASGAH